MATQNFDGDLIVTGTITAGGRKVARLENTDGDPGDTIFVGETEPTPPIEEGDAWLPGSGGVSQAQIDDINARLDTLEAAPELQAGDDSIDLPAPSGGVQLISAAPVMVRRDEVDATDKDFVSESAIDLFTSAGADVDKVPTGTAVRDALGLVKPIFGIVGTDQNVVNNSTTVANVTSLTFSLPALGRYKFYMWLHLVGSGTADARIRINATGGFNDGRYTLTAPTTSWAGGGTSLTSAVLRSFNTEYASLGAATNVVWEATGWITTAFSAGTVQVLLAQDVATAENLTVKAGSWIEALPMVTVLDA